MCPLVVLVFALAVFSVEGQYTDVVSTVQDTVRGEENHTFVSTHGTDYLQGCPKISDIPLMLDDQFLGMCFWDDAGNKNPLLGCNGARECKHDGSFWAVATGYKKIGSLAVKAGCTFTGFSGNNYNGSKYSLEGPKIQPLVQFPGKENDYGAFGSCRVTCRQKLPDCHMSDQPKDEWDETFSFDNRFSETPVIHTCNQTMGTHFSKEIKESLSVSEEVSEKVKSTFWNKFKASLGLSEKTGYDWNEVPFFVKSEVTTSLNKVEVSPGKAVKIKQVVGICGASKVYTELTLVETSGTGDVVVTSVIWLLCINLLSKLI